MKDWLHWKYPYNYILETIFDWWAFSWKQNSLNEIFSWYAKQKPNINMHKNSMKILEDILSQLKKKIKEVAGS